MPASVRRRPPARARYSRDSPIGTESPPGRTLSRARGGRDAQRRRQRARSPAPARARRWASCSAGSGCRCSLARELPEPDCPPVRVHGAGRGAPRLPRHARTASASSTHAARTAAPTSSSGATRTAASAASTTAGSSTSTGAASRSRRWRATRALRSRVGLTAYPARGVGRPRSGPTWARPSTSPSSRAGLRPRAPDRTASSPRSCRSATGRRRARARSTPPTSRSCTRRVLVPRGARVGRAATRWPTPCAG